MCGVSSGQNKLKELRQFENKEKNIKKNRAAFIMLLEKISLLVKEFDEVETPLLPDTPLSESKAYFN